MALDIQLEAGTLAPPACYGDDQERLEAFVAAITATSTGDVQWHVGTTEPASNDEYWLLVDVNGRPTDILKWSVADAAWVRLLAQLQICSNAVGTDNYTLTMAPVFTTAASAYLFGRTYIWVVPNTNTGAVTISVDGLAAQPLVKLGATPLVAGDLVTNQVVMVMSDGTNFHLLSPVASTLTVDVSNITPGTDGQFLRTATGPVTQWESAFEGAQTAIPAAGAGVDWSHGLATLPIYACVRFRCIDAGGDVGYALNDEVDAFSVFTSDSGDQVGSTVMVNATTIRYVRNAQSGLGLQLANKTTGVSLVAIDTAKWMLVAYAIR